MITHTGATSDETKEVYARFGLAYYMGELLHRGLCHLYLLTRLPDSGAIARPRVEELLREAYSTTMGEIARLLEAGLPAELVQRIRSAVEHRNFLAHHFWFERIHLMPNSAGTAQLVEELASYTDEFQALDKAVEERAATLRSRLPISDELMRQAFAEVITGRPLEPLLNQRRPKKQETIVAVHEAPVGPGKRLLVFEAVDGTLWQLCDAGLGWTFYSEVGEDWTPAERFKGLLPAKIDPRPAMGRPWNYEIPFGKSSTLSVQLGKEPNSIRWKLKRS